MERICQARHEQKRPCLFRVRGVRMDLFYRNVEDEEKRATT